MYKVVERIRGKNGKIAVNVLMKDCTLLRATISLETFLNCNHHPDPTIKKRKFKIEEEHFHELFEKMYGYSILGIFERYFRDVMISTAMHEIPDF